LWHVDESQTSNDVDTHRLLDLEEADEALTGDHPTDSGDPWHDTATGWGPDTVPDSRSYSGSETEWRIRDISASGATMPATIARASEEIPTRGGRAAHTLVTPVLCRDDFESGSNAWTPDGLSPDPHRSQIVAGTDLNGAAHSRTHAWRFGYVSTLLPSLFPPEWHKLTSPAIPIDPGPTFLIFYQRYDLTGRTVPVLPVGSNDTDDAYVEVRYNGGPWPPLAHYP